MTHLLAAILLILSLVNIFVLLKCIILVLFLRGLANNAVKEWVNFHLWQDVINKYY